MKKPWYKNWWGILLIVLFLWPFFLTYWVWKKKWNIKVRAGLIAAFWLFVLVILASSGSKSGQQSLQEGYKAGKEIVSNSTPTSIPTGKGAAKQISDCPTKTTGTYKVVKCVVLLDATNKQYNDLEVIINPLLRSQEDKVRTLANTIKTNECPKDCLLNIWDDVDSANLAFTYDLLSEADQEKWKQDHAPFFAPGGGLEKHFIATFDTDGNKFDYMVEPPAPTPRKFVYELEKPYFVDDEKWQTIIVPNDSTIEELTNLAKDIHKNNPEVYYNIFDNKDEFIAYQKWAISKNDQSVYFPDKWVKEHSIGMINKMLTTNRGINNRLLWQLYPTPSDFWGNSVPEAADLE